MINRKLLILVNSLNSKCHVFEHFPRKPINCRTVCDLGSDLRRKNWNRLSFRIVSRSIRAILREFNRHLNPFYVARQRQKAF